MAAAPALKISNVTKRFDKLTAVDNLTLEIHAGEIYSLIGPNGAGKTTTVKMISGLIEPTQGDIHILGHDIVEEPVASKQYIGYIPDEPIIYPYLTGQEFIEFVGDMYGLSRKETHRRSKTLIELYQLQDVINGLFSDYSRGNKQKTIIIANLIHNPKLLLIDEPIVGLDVESQHITKQLFQDFAQQGGAILLCTHTLSIAQEISHRIGIFNHGNLLKEGTYRELKKALKTEATLETIYLHELKK